jgi:hypothetical protein
MRADHRPVTGEVEYTITPNEYSMTIEEFMDRNFGTGAWVHDEFDDKFIAVNEYHEGPGQSYIVVDRKRRQHSATLRPSLLN